MKSYEVRIWDVGKREIRGKTWHRVRWSVAGAPKPFEKLFAKKGLAVSFRSDLESAANAGQPFDTETGRPMSEARAARQGVSWFAHSVRYIDKKWPRLAPNSRRSSVEALTDLAVLLTRSTRRGRMPEKRVLRAVLRARAFNPRCRHEPLTDEEAKALEWLEGVSLPVVDMANASLLRSALDGLCVKLDGSPAGATVVVRKRSTFYNALAYAVEEGILEANPLDSVKWTAPKVAKAIDRRIVANPSQVAAMLDALSEHGARARRLVAFFGGIYYVGGRPSEVADLRPGQCIFPAECSACGFSTNDVLAERAKCCEEPSLKFDWGVVTFVETEPRSGSNWTDDGRPNQRRGLKHRARKETRPVSAPPEYGALLYAHVSEFPLAQDGRMFYGLHGGPLSESVWDRWWKIARQVVLTPAQLASPLARRAYDLRHAAASLWIAAGVPVTEVARRLGHSLRVLLETYANFIDGGDDGLNGRISTALAR